MPRKKSNAPAQPAKNLKVGSLRSGKNGHGKYKVATVKKPSGGWLKRWRRNK